MEWMEAFLDNREPTMEDMAAFVNNPLWGEMNARLQSAYQTAPKISFSGCSGQPGWNAKYQKGGRALCTLYPMEGFFIALVVVGEKERVEVELMLPGYTAYIQDLYQESGALMGAKWLMAAVTTEEILRDLMAIIAIRRPPKGLPAVKTARSPSRPGT